LKEDTAALLGAGTSTTLSCHEANDIRVADLLGSIRNNREEHPQIVGADAHPSIASRSVYYQP
jgi:hypothetical protein